MQVGAFRMPADVVDFSCLAVPPNSVNGGAVIADVNPIADVQAVAINRHRLIAEKIHDKER